MDNVNRIRDLSMGWLFCSNFQRFIALGERCIVVLVNIEGPIFKI